MGRVCGLTVNVYVIVFYFKSKPSFLDKSLRDSQFEFSKIVLNTIWFINLDTFF